MPDWQIWAQKLEVRDPALADGLDEIAEYDVKAIHRHVTDDERARQRRRWRATRLLQRALDRTRELDSWKLRLLVSESGNTHGTSYTSAREDLARALGAQHVEGFLQLAGQYFAQSRQARSGLWFEEGKGEGGLLVACGVHPPHKKGMLARMVCNVLNIVLDERAFEKVRQIVESETIAPSGGLAGRRDARRRKITTCLAEFSDLQKDLGGDLRLLYQDAATRSSEERRDWGTDESRTRAWNAYQWAAAIGACIGQALEHDDARFARYSNPYSLAQLHQLLYQDRGGFASNCRACLAENGWRAQLDAKGTANASRLPADSVRPFDGMLARLLRAKASRIATAIAGDLDLPADATALSIPLLLEENRFEFTEQIANLKGVMGKRLEKIASLGESRREEWQQRWRDKWQRIQDAGLCPYCGDQIGESGDFDHIVSQAGTRDIAGYAFDAEPNLIFAHKTCNASKGRAQYTLDNLQRAYLNAVFSTSDRDAIRQEIAATCEPWLDARSDRRAFHQLPDDLQRAVRHALFLPELRNKVLAKIANQNKARVNGTQRWFARQLAMALRKAFARNGVTIPLEFDVHRVLYTDVGELRQRLAHEAPEDFEKVQPQPPYSHAVDAALVFALASTDPKVRGTLGLNGGDEANMTEFVEPDRAAALLPESLRIVPIGRRPKYAEGVKPWHQPLFKANPIGERFVPIGVDNEQRLWVGFSADNRFELPAPKPTEFGKPKPDPRLALLQMLWSVLRIPGGMAEPDMALLAQRATQREAGILWLKVDRRKAFEYMRVAKHDPNDTREKALHALLYHIQRADLEKTLRLDGKGKSIDKTAPSAADLLKDKDFTIKVKFAGFNERKLTLPAKAAWQRLCEDKALEKHLGADKLIRQRSDGEVPEGRVAINWDALMQRHFPQGETDRVHRRKRQVYSLPRIASASGGFRTRRLDPDGRPVYQLLQVEGGAYAGFSENNSRLGFDHNAPQLLKAFAESRNLTPLNPKARQTQIVPFDRPILMSTNTLAKLRVDRFELIPATDARRSVRMTLSWEALAELLPELEFPDSFRHQSAVLELSKADAQRLAAKLQQAIGVAALGPRVAKDKASIAIERMDAEAVKVYWSAGTGANSREASNVEAEQEEANE